MIWNPAARKQRFPPETLRRLFEAVHVNDVVDAHVSLPKPIDLACPEDTIRRCFSLSFQLWDDGFERKELLQLVRKLLREEGLTADERVRYKHIRARYKQLRFAQRLYGRRHEAADLFDRTTRALGNLQDAFRHQQPAAIAHYGTKLGRLLSASVWMAVRHTVKHTRLDTSAGFLAHRQAEMRRLKGILTSATVTGHEFHAMRKIVSQQVSFYDTLRSLEPSEHAYKMSRFLAAINGLMGSQHDDMVARSLSDRDSYESAEPLAREIRWRLDTLVARYPLAPASQPIGNARPPIHVGEPQRLR